MKEDAREYLFNTKKMEYVTGHRPQVDCILCAVREHAKEVQSLELYRSEHAIVTVNLYPFSPGHLMIYPSRHMEDITELTQEEFLDIHSLLQKTVALLKDEFHPSGFNIGWNLGKGSGASISHIHMHIVPRFENEIGFLDVIAGARVFVVDPEEVLQRLKKRFEEF